MHFQSWDEFNENTKNNPPRQLCLEAVKLVQHKGRALDIGAGALSDSKYLLEQGFEVMAIDFNPSLSKLVQAIDKPNLKYKVCMLEDFYPETDTYDYINAMFVLPFIRPDKFYEVLSRLYKSLVMNGIMAFQLFGNKDEWANKPSKDRFHKGMTFLNSEEVNSLLKDISVIKNEESIKDDKLANGDIKKWHQFQIILQK